MSKILVFLNLSRSELLNLAIPQISSKNENQTEQGHLSQSLFEATEWMGMIAARST